MHMGGMRVRKSAIIFTIILVVQLLTPYGGMNNVSEADPLPKFYVDDDYDGSTPGWGVDHFNCIQDAINESGDGDRIIVYAGVYNENIVINKTSLNVFGEDRSLTTINATNSSNAVTITNAYVDFSDFTIQNSGNNSDDAVIYVDADNCNIIDNVIREGNHGIFINNCDDTTIYYNTITANNGDGIHLYSSDDNSITYNTIIGNNNGIFGYNSLNNDISNNPSIKQNHAHGIFLNETCMSNTIFGNNVSSNEGNGIYLNDQCNYNTQISSNNVYSNNNSGIRIVNSSHNYAILNNMIKRNNNYGLMISGSYNIVQNCTISGNKWHGLFLFADDNNTISSNLISTNSYDGIRMHNSTLDLIHTNEICHNMGYGVHLNYYTLLNGIYNNYFHDNTDNALDISENHNTWNLAQTGTNIVGGSSINGNYWDDYDEIDEGAFDANEDGIADDPHLVDLSSSDGGALLDVTDPVIGAPQVVPSDQIVGGTISISVTITDEYTGIKQVYLTIIDPNDQSSNFSIFQNRSGDTFSCSKQFSTIGEYSFYIAAKDSRNWVRTSTENPYTFNMMEGTAPTILDNSPIQASPSSSFTFSATLTDDQDPASEIEAYVIWSHGSEGGNYSLIHSDDNYFERTVMLDSSIDQLTYYFYAMDQWGNDVKSPRTNVTVTDTIAPTISIQQYGPSFEDLPGSYTFAAVVTDNCAVSDVYIEYWYDGSEKLIADMTLDPTMGDNYYKKVIIPQGSPETVYCVIYANDTSDNLRDTKNPTAKNGGPYLAVIAEEVTFDASESFDLDGNIVSYSWDFGDGTTGEGISSSHSYYSNGNYTISLTVVDDEANTNMNTTYCLVIDTTKITSSDATLATVSSLYNLTLTKKFYSYDTDGDQIVDTFYDPNEVLTPTHTNYMNLSGNISFLISTADDDIPEFIWKTNDDSIVTISHSVGIIDDVSIDEENEQAILSVIVEKANWIYIEIDDEYPDASLQVKTGDRTISSDMMWRKNNKIYVLDDPETTYQFIFQDIFPSLQSPTFRPVDGGIIDEDHTTITVTYNVPVSISYASYFSFRIENKLITTDNMVFTYTPPSYLENGTHVFEIEAEAMQGTDYDISSASYFYFSYGSPPQQSFLEKNWLMMLFGLFCGGLAALLLFFRVKHVSIDDFLYIKNRKILPFIRTVIFGPLSIKIEDPTISKAEFYIDGTLKDTLTDAPFYWKWDEKAFMKHTLETKIYDEDGNSASSGEKTFFIFHNPLKFK